MSERASDWDGSRPPAETGVGPSAPLPPIPGHSTPPLPLPEEAVTTAPQPLDFVLGEGVGQADDSPTIISRSVRKPGDAAANSVRGKVLAHFELLEPIGVGGMAAVIRAHDKQLDRAVALKILPPAMSTDVESLRRFQNEARAAARLDHENIARVFFCGEDQGLHFIAFEFVEGENLRVILDRRGRLPVAEAIKYMLQVAAGLAHASSRGVVHRDIKPSNIVITPTGRAKLVDMGLARSMGPNLDGSLTQSGVTLGTFDYISPEQALEPRDADVRSDIYSLGCTFYHMLTGQAPVPEGTAAKKLHYHQHVPPIDPRQLNPAVNDDVAAVLGRMMAKDPKNRYQRPEHLVQHMLQLAHKIGASAEVPEGVMFVDAPLPGPPGVRPLLVGGLAAGALVLVVLIIGLLPGASKDPEIRPLYPLPGVKDQTPPKGVDKLPPGAVVKTPPTVDDPPTPVAPTPKQVTVQTTRELSDAVKNATTILLADRLFDLRARREDGGAEPAGLVLPAKDIVLQAEDPTRRPTIQLKYDASARDELPLWAALTARGGTVTLRNLRFVIDAAGTETPMACIAGEGARIKFERCEFVHTGFPPDDSDRARLYSVHLAGRPVESRDGLPDAAFDRCYFPGGHQAVTWETSARVAVKDCVFGPHAALFHFRGNKVDDAQLELQHVSAMLAEREAVFLLSNGASARLVVNNSLFSRPGGALVEDENGAVLVRQTGEGLGRVRFESESRNIYHNLWAYLVQGASVRAATLDSFRLVLGVGANDRSVTVQLNPWALEKPRPALAQTPEKAFQASQELAELRRLDNPRLHMVGAENSVWGALYPSPLRALKEKIVDPTVMFSAQGIYPTLSQAIGEAQPGDVILLRTNKELLVKPIHLEDYPNTDLTIKPDGGFRPVLKLGATTDVDAAMFRLSDGKLHLENLEFELPAPQAGMTAQSLVQIAGEGQASFANCLLTVQEAREGAQVVRSVVTLGGRAMMRKEPRVGPPLAPRLELKNCFVRGDGNLLTVRGSQALNLEVTDTLAVLDGSLLVMEGSDSEPPLKPPVTVTLTRVTAYLNEPMLWLKACPTKMMPGLVPTQVSRVTNCVFVSARDKNALIHLDGMDSDEQMKRLFTWGEGTQNVYSGFGPMLEQRPRADGAMPLSQFDKGKWEDFTPRETDRRFERVTFAAVSDKPMSRALPSQFKIKEPDLPGCGADVERLPRPRAEADGAAPGEE